MVVDLQLKSESFSRDLDKVKGQVSRSRKQFDDLGASVKRWGMSFLSIGAAVQTVKFLATTAMEAEQASMKLEASLNATGYAAGLTAKQITAMAEAMERRTLFDDKDIKAAASELLTFKRIAGDTFERTLKSAADMSAMFGGDLSSNVMLLGKALDNPIAGMTMLTRKVGAFTEVEKAQIKTLVESNRLHEAQAMILAKVEGKVQGVADAMGAKGLTGAVNLVTDSFENMLEANLAFTSDHGLPNWLTSVAEKLERLRFQPFDLMKTLKLQQFMGFSIAPVVDPLNTDDLLKQQDAAIGKAQAKVDAAAEEADRKRHEADEKWKKGAGDRERAEKELLESQLKGLAALADETKRITENRTEQWLIGLQAQEDAEKDFLDFLKKDMEAFDKAQKEFAKDEAARKWAAGWGHAMEEVQDKIAKGFEALFLGQIESFRDFASMLLTIWAQTMAQMAAADITGGLFGFLKGAAGLGSGGGFGNFGAGSPIGAPMAPDLSMASGGGGMVVQNISFNVSAIDGASVGQFFAQNKSAIKAIVAQEAKRDWAFARAIGAPV